MTESANRTAAAVVLRTKNLTLAAMCLALNVGLGKVSNVLGLPFTMDTIGTVLGAALLPWYLVLFVGAASSLVATVVIHPAFLYFVGTQIAIALTAVALFRLGMFAKLWTAAPAGLLIGIVSAIVSAPVIVVVFGGVAVPSISAVNALLLATGRSLWESVVAGSLAVESVDKVAAAVVAYLVIRRINRSRS